MSEQCSLQGQIQCFKSPNEGKEDQVGIDMIIIEESTLP